MERFPPPPLTPYLKLLFYYLFISLRKHSTLCCYHGHLFICLSSLSSGFKRAEITLVTLWLCALCLEQCPRHGNLSTDIIEWIFINEYTEELYKKDLHDPDNHNGVITHLEPDILECEVKWALEIITTNKASGGDAIPVELFQILKDDAVKVLQSICQHIWKTQQ